MVASIRILSVSSVGNPSLSIPAFNESWILWAAFPVGAANPIFNDLSGDCFAKYAKIYNTVVVLPVPGPPEIRVKEELKARLTACSCSLLNAEEI